MFQFNVHNFSSWFEIGKHQTRDRNYIPFLQSLSKNCETLFLTSSYFLFHLPHEQISYHSTNFRGIFYWCIRRKSVTKIKFTLRCNTIKTGTLHEDQYKLLIISSSVFLRMKNFSDIFIEEFKTH